MEVTESKIRAFLDERALELKRIQTPLYEELYETSMRSSEIPASTGPAESFIAPLNPAIAKQQTHSPSKSPGSLSGRSIGIRSSQESETSASSGSPSGTGAPSPSVNCSPLLEILSAGLNEWKGLIIDTQQPLPSPRLSSSERQRLWKEELEQELRMKREEKRKQFAKQGSQLKGASTTCQSSGYCFPNLAASSHLRIWPDTLLCSLPPILVHGDGLPMVMYFPSPRCKVFLSLSVCSVCFSVAFYICDLLYNLLRLSFGKQDQLPTPT